MRSPRAALPLAFALLVVLLSASAAGVAGTPPLASAAGPEPASVQQTNDPPTPGSVVVEIQLQRDGDAAFTVLMAFALENETDREAFDDLAADFEDGTAEADLGADAFRRASERASNATGREMRVTGVERNGVVENDTGVLRLSFTWTNFAESSARTYRIGDAFNTTEGTWLSELTPRQTLVIQSPPGYAVLNAPPGAGVTQGDLVWEGPTVFEPGDLRATFQPGAATPTPTTPNDDPTAALLGTFVVGAGVLALGIYWFVYRERPETEPKLESEDVPAADAESEPGGETAVESAGETGGADPREAETEDETADEERVDLELLSDEERVEHLLQQNGGRMKQASIVKETGWSNAKVSQLLSSMADEDRVQKLRIGRENLIALPEEDIGELDSE